MFEAHFYRDGDKRAPPYQQYLHADGTELTGAERPDPRVMVTVLEDDGVEFPSGIQRDAISLWMSMFGFPVKVVCHFDQEPLVIEEPRVWKHPPVLLLYRECNVHPVSVNYRISAAGQLIGQPGTDVRSGQVTILIEGDGSAPNIMQRHLINRFIRVGCEPVYYFAVPALA